jgi:hypothetical protein
VREEHQALLDIVSAVTGHYTAPAQKRALRDLESALIARGWPSSDGTGSVALAAVSIAKHSCYFWNWVFEDFSLGKASGVEEELMKDKIIVADFIAFTAVLGSSFGPTQISSGQLIGAIIAAGSASAVAAVVEHADAVRDFFKKLFH